jgi:hypothetical protein
MADTISLDPICQQSARSVPKLPPPTPPLTPGGYTFSFFRLRPPAPQLQLIPDYGMIAGIQVPSATPFAIECNNGTTPGVAIPAGPKTSESS